MINEQYKAMLGGKSIIRELSEYATERGKEIGYENVFELFPGQSQRALPGGLHEDDDRAPRADGPHGAARLQSSLTIPSVRQAVAESLNRRFGWTTP